MMMTDGHNYNARQLC